MIYDRMAALCEYPADRIRCALIQQHTEWVGRAQAASA
jgi:hypothetical protein